MAATIFVWLDSASGHASLSLDGQKSSDDPYAAYISFYPDPRRSNINTTSLSKFVLSGVPGVATTMKQNVHSDKGARRRTPQFASAPIEGLDEKAIMTFWADFRHRNPEWSLARSNCADIVFKALDAGGAKSKSLAAAALIFSARFQTVFPRDCILLARALGG